MDSELSRYETYDLAVIGAGIAWDGMRRAEDSGSCCAKRIALDSMHRLAPYASRSFDEFCSDCAAE